MFFVEPPQKIYPLSIYRRGGWVEDFVDVLLSVLLDVKKCINVLPYMKKGRITILHLLTLKYFILELKNMFIFRST